MTEFNDLYQTDPARLARPDVQALTPYQSARRIAAAAGIHGDVWLNANESSDADAMAPLESFFNRYPDPQPEAVVKAYAAYAGLNEDQVLVTRGGDEGIELFVRTFCRPGEDAVLQFPPTYGMYSVSAQTNGAEVINLVTRPEDNWTPNAEATREMLEKRPDIKVVFACSPGNPTGSLIPSDVLEALAKATLGRAILVIDEAYIEFAPETTAVGLLAKYPHVALIRTLSKAFALAGLRCGFVLSSPDVINVLKKVIAPYPIPTPTADIAAQALSPEGIERMRRRATDCVARRDVLRAALAQLPGVQNVVASNSNFLLVKFHEADRIFTALRAQGIILHDQSRQPTLENCIRVTIGTEPENERLLATLNALLTETR